MENVPSAIWIIFMGMNHNGGGEVLKTYLMKFPTFMKNMESDISILPMLISSGPAEKGKERASELAGLIS